MFLIVFFCFFFEGRKRYGFWCGRVGREVGKKGGATGGGGGGGAEAEHARLPGGVGAAAQHAQLPGGVGAAAQHAQLPLSLLNI